MRKFFAKHKNLTRVLLLVLILCLTETVFEFFLVPRRTDREERENAIRINAERGLTPDTLLLGNSTASFALRPEVFDTELHGTDFTLNLSSGLRSLRGMYYSLLDMTARYDIKTVVISVEYLQVMEQAMSPEAELLVIDEMKDPRSITEDIRDTFTVEQLPFLLKSFRYRTNMHAAGKIAGEKIAQFSARDSEAGAADKPAAADKPEATDKPAADKPAAAPKAAGSEKKEAAAPKKVWLDNGKVGFVVNLPWKADMKMTSYLDRMLDLCRKKGIEVYLVSTPLTMTALVNAGDCELAHDVVQKEADRYGVPYFDMNLIRDRQQKFPNIYMTDSEHLNMDGAKKCTGMLCSAIHYYRKEKSDGGLLYTGYGEARAALKGILGVDFDTEPTDDEKDPDARLIRADCATAGDTETEYKYTVQAAGSKSETLLQDYSAKATCPLPGKYSDVDETLTVYVRKKGDTEPVCFRSKKINEETWKDDAH